MSTPVPAIVLAAGASQRLGQPKQLLVYHGEFLIERAIRLANEAGASPVIAVLGAHYEIICASIAMNDAILAINDKWVEGIASSIHAGLRTLDAVAGGASGVLILSCDQPRLTAGHLRGLIETLPHRLSLPSWPQLMQAFMASPPYFLAACLRICSRCEATRARAQCWFTRRAL